MSHGEVVDPVVVGFGTAHLYGVVDPDTSAVLLDAAAAAGFTRLDTAPSYGFGVCEAEVGRRRAGAAVTTKVGLEPRARPSALRAALPRLLGPVAAPLRAARARRAGPGDGATGRFEPVDVRRSVDRSYRRLGRLDRLLLHEVAPADITDGLLALLAELRAAGVVDELGVATAPHLTAEALHRGDGLLTVAQLAAGPYDRPVPPLPTGTRVVGHGLLGPAGRDLGRVRRELAADASLRTRWEAAVAGTAWAGAAGLATALLQSALTAGLDEVVVATSRPVAVAGLAVLGAGLPVPTDPRWAELARVLRAASLS